MRKECKKSARMANSLYFLTTITMLTRYKKNLRVEGNKVYSYNTHVATISGKKLLGHGYWSVTTSKHINYVASRYGLTKKEAKKNKERGRWEGSVDSTFKAVSMAAAFGDLILKTKEEKNDWKVRMMKAGLENKGLIMPDDWDTLSEDVKEARLNGALKVLSSTKNV